MRPGGLFQAAVRRGRLSAGKRKVSPGFTLDGGRKQKHIETGEDLSVLVAAFQVLWGRGEYPAWPKETSEQWHLEDSCGLDPPLKEEDATCGTHRDTGAAERQLNPACRRSGIVIQGAEAGFQTSNILRERSQMFHRRPIA